MASMCLSAVRPFAKAFAPGPQRQPPSGRQRQTDSSAQTRGARCTGAHYARRAASSLASARVVHSHMSALLHSIAAPRPSVGSSRLQGALSQPSSQMRTLLAHAYQIRDVETEAARAELDAAEARARLATREREAWLAGDAVAPPPSAWPAPIATSTPDSKRQSPSSPLELHHLAASAHEQRLQVRRAELESEVLAAVRSLSRAPLASSPLVRLPDAHARHAQPAAPAPASTAPPHAPAFSASFAAPARAAAGAVPSSLLAGALAAPPSPARPPAPSAAATRLRSPDPERVRDAAEWAFARELEAERDRRYAREAARETALVAAREAAAQAQRVDDIDRGELRRSIARLRNDSQRLATPPRRHTVGLFDRWDDSLAAQAQARLRAASALAADARAASRSDTAQALLRKFDDRLSSIDASLVPRRSPSARPAASEWR